MLVSLSHEIKEISEKAFYVGLELRVWKNSQKKNTVLVNWVAFILLNTVSLLLTHKKPYLTQNFHIYCLQISS